MFSPDQIEALRIQSGKIISPVIEFLISDIASRIAEAGQLTSTAAYQIWRAQNLGFSQRQLKKELRKRLKVSHRELRKLLTQAAEVGYDFDIKRFPFVQAVPFDENESLQRIVQTAADMADENLTNLTQTMGFVTYDGKVTELTEAYRKSCDFAFEKIFTGAQDYSSAIRQATKGLAEKGIQTIDYESGVHRSMEAAVRGSFMGGLGIMQEEISQQNHDDLGCDGWEISAHRGSAPDHEPFQGKQYSDAEYTRLNNSLVRRIGTLNCGHSAMGIIMGINDPQYTPEELAEMKRENAEGITYEDGKHYTLYEATQRQRGLERTLRKQKRKILIDEKTGDEDKLAIDQTRYVIADAEYKRFSKAAGLRLQHERANVPGFGSKQHSAVERVEVSHDKNDDIVQVFNLNAQYCSEAGSFDIQRAKKDYSEFLTTVPEKNRIFLEQSFESVEYEQRELKWAPFGYKADEDKILYDPSKEEFWDYDFTVSNTHELAHRVDHFFVQSAENSPFSDAIANASKVVNADPEKYMRYCMDNDYQGFLSDTLSAICNSRYRFPYGHKSEYWKTSGNKEREIFANLFSMEALQDAEKLNFFRENFPELYTIYEGFVY